MLVMKCLPTLRLLMTLPAFTPILSASFTRPACTDALILPSSFSVVAVSYTQLAAMAGQRGIAVADQDDLTEPEFISDDRDDFPERDRVGGIAREYPDRDRDPGPAGDHAELDLLPAFLPVPGMPERAQRAAMPFQPRRRQIKQCQPAAGKVPGGELAFDRVLPRQRPVHRRRSEEHT